MAKGVQERLQSAISLAVTGVAGPDGGTPNKPVGTVWCCLARKGKKSRVWLLQLHGNREEIILASCQSLLEALIEECRPHT
jgi:nicotinamide-nucleotide amidase